MGKNERQAYLREIRARYRRSSRQAKGCILDRLCAVCGYHRKYAIRLLGRPQRRTARHPGRARYADDQPHRHHLSKLQKQTRSPAPAKNDNHATGAQNHGTQFTIQSAAAVLQVRKARPAGPIRKFFIVIVNWFTDRGPPSLHTPIATTHADAPLTGWRHIMTFHLRFPRSRRRRSDVGLLDHFLAWTVALTLGLLVWTAAYLGGPF